MIHCDLKTNSISNPQVKPTAFDKNTKFLDNTGPSWDESGTVRKCGSLNGGSSDTKEGKREGRPRGAGRQHRIMTLRLRRRRKEEVEAGKRRLETWQQPNLVLKNRSRSQYTQLTILKSQSVGIVLEGLVTAGICVIVRLGNWAVRFSVWQWAQNQSLNLTPRFPSLVIVKGAHHHLQCYGWLEGSF